jgi:opacity protein-like surface antigen
MRKLLMLVAVLFVAAIPASAQDDYPSAEIFGGYAYLNADALGDRESFHGWGLSFAGNLGPRFGLVGEFSGHYGEVNIAAVDLDVSAYTYLFGPRVSARSDKATVFGHILVGGATVKVEGISGTDFAMAIGGGVDVNASKNFAVRFQVDYLPVFADDTSHNFRFMTGIVFKVGGN